MYQFILEEHIDYVINIINFWRIICVAIKRYDRYIIIITHKFANCCMKQQR